MIGRITGQKEKIYERGSFGMKQRTKYSKRCLAVLLAILMLLAAAQPVSLVAAAAGDDPDPQFGEGAARARYTTSGTLEISFPEAQAIAGGISYYADFYDLDRGYPQRETPIVSAVELSGARTMAGESALIFSELSAEQIKAYGLNMSHRISVAITAVDADGWRSQPIEALVGDSLDVPAAGASPTGSDRYTSVSRFEDAYNAAREDGGTHDSGAKFWEYNNGNGTAAMNIDGVYDGNKNAYQTPGFDNSQAFRFYMNGNERSADSYERFDVMYNQDHYQFKNAEELWIWVDTSYVSFEEFALQVRYMDYTGTLRIDSGDFSVEGNWITHAYSKDVYSTVGYAKQNHEAVPVYYQNADGLWDTMYTNTDGYLEDFGHYRGFLRVPIDKLWNEDASSSYKQLTTEHPYSYEISVWDGYVGVNTERAHFTAETAYTAPEGSLSWIDREYKFPGWEDRTIYFDKTRFENTTGYRLGVTPIEDIASVGFTWRGASEDSMNKPFYIDQIGFSGKNLETNDPGSSIAPLQTLDTYHMVPSDQEAVEKLVNQHIPDVEAVNVADAGIIEDLEAICAELSATVTLPEKLKQARERLNQILNGQDPVLYLHTELQKADADIPALFELYQTFTLGELQRFGLKDEADLIRRYNETGQSEWYPSALTQLYFKAFNDVEQNYTVGQTAIHEYDDYRLEPNGKWHYFDRAHHLLWENGIYKGAWENSKNLVAYSRSSYDSAETGTNSTDQRFSLASTSVGQNGFASSRSIDTSFYRDSLSNGETYRISLTHNGENKDNWDALSGVNIGQATDFIFYADFSEMNDIRKMWVALRTENGNIYSHDEDDGTQWDYQILDMDAAIPAWKTVQTDNDGNDGCMTGASLNGFRGFIKIPLSHFCEITSNGNAGPVISANAVVKQIKLFYTGSQGGESPAGTTMSVDMFGFSSGTPISGFEQLHPERELEEPQLQSSDVESAVAAILALYEDVTLLNETEAKTDYLFSYGRTEQSITAYREMLALYHTLTVTEKGEVDQKLPANIKMADMEAFVRNYDTFGGVQGNLKKYVDSAVAQRETIENAFQKTAVSTGPVVTLLEEYNDYPAKYQNAVLTYWADRNLSAVFPNFTVQTDQITTNTSADDPLITMQINAEGTAYSGSAALPFYAAAADPYNVELDIPSTVELSMGDTKITVPINGRKLNPTDPGTMNFELSIAESSVEKSGVYTGSFNVTLKTPVADKGTNQGSNTISGGVPNAESYRMETYTVYVQLVCDASYTVVIPADVGVGWGRTDRVEAGSLKVENLFIPTTASVEVGVTSENEFKMIHNSFALPYRYQTGDLKDFRGDTFNMSTTDLERELYVEVPNWSGAPSDQYKDTLTFTVTYHEP